MPCCKEIEGLTSLLNVDSVCRLIRLILGKVRLTINCYALFALSCTLNELLQWVVKVALKFMDSKGVGTLKRADVICILEKAPIFETVHQHLEATEPFCESIQEEIRSSEPSADLYASHTSSQTAPVGLGLCNDSPSTERIRFHSASPPSSVSQSNTPLRTLSVEQLCKMVGNRLNPTLLDTWSSPAIPKPSPATSTRYVACIDQHFPWLQVKDKKAEQVSFVQSSSVETDQCSGLYASSVADKQEIARLQTKVDTLKALVIKLLSK